MRVTLEILLRDQLHFSIVSWSVDVMKTTNNQQPRFQTAWFLGLIAGSDEVFALQPDGVQRHHGECRVSPLDDPESNLRELKKCSCAHDGSRLASTWVQDVPGCAMSQRMALCGMQRKSSSYDGT